MKPLLIFALLFIVIDGIVRIRIEKKGNGKAAKIGKHLLKSQKRTDCENPPGQKRSFFVELEKRPLSSRENSFWLGEVLLGKRKKPFKINFDTGSHTFWTACDCIEKEENTCAGHTSILNCKESTDCVKTSADYCVGYGDGSFAYGVWAKERVCIGHLCTEEKQWFGCANYTVEGTDENSTGDGLMGLTYNNGTMEWSPVHQILKKPDCKEKVFSFYLDPKALDGTDNSELTICDIDNKHYKGNLQWFKTMPNNGVNGENYFWMLNVTSVLVGGKEMWSGSVGLVPDTGADQTSLPLAAWDLLQSLMMMSNPDDYPIVTYVIDGNHHFNVPPISYCRGNPKSKCDLLFMGWDVKVLGDSFLRSNYITFDPINGRIGLAPSV